MPNLECVPGQIEPEKRDAKSSCAIVSPLGAISETGLGFLSWKQQFLPVRAIVMWTVVPAVSSMKSASLPAVTSMVGQQEDEGVGVGDGVGDGTSAQPGVIANIFQSLLSP